MSYSFKSKGDSTGAAKTAAAEQFAAVVAGQPEHRADVPAVRAAVDALIDAQQPGAAAIEVEVSGSISRNGDGELTYAAASIQVRSSV